MLTGNWHFNKLSRCLEIYESKFRSFFPKPHPPQNKLLIQDDEQIQHFRQGSV